MTHHSVMSNDSLHIEPYCSSNFSSIISRVRISAVTLKNNSQQSATAEKTCLLITLHKVMTHNYDSFRMELTADHGYVFFAVSYAVILNF